MFSLQRSISSQSFGTLAQAYRILGSDPLVSTSSSRCVIFLCQHQSQNQLRLASTTAKLQSKVQSQKSQGSQVQPGGAKGRSTLPPYMVFRYCQPASMSHQTTAPHSTLAWDLTTSGEIVESEIMSQVQTVATRPLVLLFAWMLSKNSQIEKYRQFWIRRGYDILTVQTSPIDLLMPSVGGKKVAQNVYNFLSKITPQYDQVLVHAFSVGGYQLGEFLGRLYDGIEAGDAEAERLYKSLKGFLIDSVVFADDAAPGLSRAITLHPIVQPILEKSIAAWLKTTKPFTYDRYKVVESHIIDNRRRVPAMLLFSKDDVVSSFRSNFGVVDSWQKKGITTKAKCWETSAHVLHYREHPEEYEQEVDGFIARLDVTKAQKSRN